jgi:hypothetical protein
MNALRASGRSSSDIYSKALPKNNHAVFFHIPSLTGRVTGGANVISTDIPSAHGTGNMRALSRQGQYIGRKRNLHLTPPSRTGRNMCGRQPTMYHLFLDNFLNGEKMFRIPRDLLLNGEKMSRIPRDLPLNGETIP